MKSPAKKTSTANATPSGDHMTFWLGARHHITIEWKNQRARLSRDHTAFFRKQAKAAGVRTEQYLMDVIVRGIRRMTNSTPAHP